MKKNIINSFISSFVIQTFPILIVHVTNNQECEESFQKEEKKRQENCK